MPASVLLRSFEIWQMTNQARAYDNHVYTGRLQRRWGRMPRQLLLRHSMIVSPSLRCRPWRGAARRSSPSKLDPDPIKRITYGSNTPMIFDHLQDRNLAAYQTS